MWLVVLAPLVLVVAIRSTSLNGLPDIGDPFDVEEFCREIPDEDNAFVLYKQASAKLGKEPDWGTKIWSTAGPIERQWLESSREALEIWKKGTSRPDALYFPPKSLNIGTLLPAVQSMRTFGRLAALEGTRLESEGKMNEALDWHLAHFRSSRHCGRRGFIIGRLVGIALGSYASTNLCLWAGDEKVDAAMLRKALDAIVAADLMTPSNSDVFKSEYMSSLNTLGDPAFQDPAKLLWGDIPWGWDTGPGRAYFRAERSIKKEPERSRRVFRLVMANWLAYCDRPPSQRPPRANLNSTAKNAQTGRVGGLWLYTPELDAPEALRAISLDELDRWFSSTLYASILLSDLSRVDKAFRRDRSAVANLKIRLANELYKREKGRYPERMEDLVGPYLTEVPEGYVPMEEEKKDAPKAQ